MYHKQEEISFPSQNLKVLSHRKNRKNVVVPEVPVCRVNFRDVAEKLDTVDLAEDLVVLEVAETVQKQLKQSKVADRVFETAETIVSDTIQKQLKQIKQMQRQFRNSRNDSTTERQTTERLMTEQLTTERLTTEQLRLMRLND